MDDEALPPEYCIKCGYATQAIVQSSTGVVFFFCSVCGTCQDMMFDDE